MKGTKHTRRHIREYKAALKRMGHIGIWNLWSIQLYHQWMQEAREANQPEPSPVVLAFRYKVLKEINREYQALERKERQHDKN